MWRTISATNAAGASVLVSREAVALVGAGSMLVLSEVG
jgi:hypothetical protein